MLRFLGGLTLVAAIVLVIGYFTGWISLGSETQAGETEMRLRINRGEIESDLDRARDKLQGQGDEIRENGESATRTGTVTGVNMSTGQISLDVANSGVLVFTVADATLIEGASGLDEVRVGDRVSMTVAKTGTGERASRVVVLPR